MPGNDEFPVDMVFTAEVALNANIVTPCPARAGKPFGMRTYEKYFRKPFRIRSYKIIGLKVP